jgi:diamine N-acetyltransferase
MSEPETPLTPTAVVTLREVTGDTVRDILRLKVKPDQTGFVADNATSIAQAHFEPKAWFRAIYADETPVGFVMLYDNPDEPEYYLWRLMVDGRYQHFGYGRQAMQHLISYVRSRPGATELLTSYVPGEGCPQPFYTSLGFVETGEVDDGENVMRLVL